MKFESLIKQYYPASEIIVVRENPTYNFVIKSASIDSNNLLFTEGLTDFEQPVNEKNAGYKSIELYFLAPSYLKINKDLWLVNWLDILAELPQKKETWFGPGDTIPAGNPPQPMTEKFLANTFMLVDPIALKDLFEENDDLEFRALGIIPIFQTEIDYKLKNSATLLMRKLTKASVNELIDIYRAPVRRKKILGF